MLFYDVFWQWRGGGNKSQRLISLQQRRQPVFRVLPSSVKIFSKYAFNLIGRLQFPCTPPPGKMVTSPSIVLTANDVHVFYKIQVDVHHAIDFNVFSIQCNIRNSVFKPGPCNMKFSYHKLYIILLSVSF